MEAIFTALSQNTGVRPQAIKDWCDTHNVDPYLMGGVIVNNYKEFVECVLDNKITETFKKK